MNHSGLTKDEVERLPFICHNSVLECRQVARELGLERYMEWVKNNPPVGYHPKGVVLLMTSSNKAEWTLVMSQLDRSVKIYSVYQVLRVDPIKKDELDARDRKEYKEGI